MTTDVVDDRRAMRVVFDARMIAARLAVDVVNIVVIVRACVCGVAASSASASRTWVHHVGAFIRGYRYLSMVSVGFIGWLVVSLEGLVFTSVMHRQPCLHSFHVTTGRRCY